MAPEADSVVRVCSKSEVTPGSVKAFAVGDKTLAVYNIDGTFYWQLHQAFPGFDGEACLLKSVAINQLYGTQIWAIPMAKNVQKVLSQPGASDWGAELVDHIAPLTLNGKTLQCTSFAAKFCHFFVNENGFPIYDEMAKQAIKLHLGDQYSSGNTKLYVTFCDNFGRLRGGYWLPGPT